MSKPVGKRGGRRGATPGIAERLLTENYRLQDLPDPIMIGHVLHALILNDRSATKAVQATEKLGLGVSLSHFLSAKRKLLKFKDLSNSRQRAKFMDWCSQPVPAIRFGTATPSSNVTPAKPLPSVSLSVSPLKTRQMKKTKCSNCSSLRLHLKKLQDLHNNTKARNRDLFKHLKGEKRPTWQLRQTISRRDRTIVKLKSELRELRRSTKQVESLKSTVKKKTKEFREKASELKRKAESAESTQTKKLKLAHRKLSLEYDDALCQLEELSEIAAPDLHMVKNTYSPTMRTLVYACLAANTPTSTISDLITQICSLLHVTAAKVPCRSTIETMAIELGLWSDLKVAEVLHGTPNVTLGFDSTTQEGVHVNSIHITTTENSYVVALDQLPGGLAIDYASHIVQSIDHLALVYSKYYDVNFDDVKFKMIEQIKCVMCDRAPVNAAAVRLLEEEFEHCLMVVHCNLHPIDTVTTKCKSVIGSLEKQRGISEKTLYSGACLAEKIVLGMNTLRFKDGAGCPAEVKIHLDEHGLPRGLISRYRGNRLHVMFHLSETYYQHYDVFMKLVASRNSQMKIAIHNGLTKDFTKLELKAFAIMSRLVSAPWMKTFYKNDSTMSYLDSIYCVQRVIANVKELIESLRLNSAGHTFTTDVFGSPLDTISQFDFFSDICPEVVNMLCLMLLETVKVLERQYESYLKLSALELEALAIPTSSARLHNIDAEEVVGMFSAAISKAPNATIPYLSAKIKAKKNSILNNLLLQCPSQASFQKTISLASEIRAKRKGERLKLNVEIVKRLHANKQKMDNKLRRALEKKLKSLVNCSQDDIEAVLPEHSDESERIHDILNGDAVSLYITHFWAEGDKFENVCYKGKIEKMNKNMYEICYWSIDQTYDEGDPTHMTPVEVATDFLLGDLAFVSGH